MVKSISLNQDIKLNNIFNQKDAKNIEKRIISGYLEGRAITMILDSMPNANSTLVFTLTDGKIKELAINDKKLSVVKKLSKTPFFLRRLYHRIVMAFNLGGYKDNIKTKAHAIAVAYEAQINQASKSSSSKKSKSYDSTPVANDLLAKQTKELEEQQARELDEKLAEIVERLAKDVEKAKKIEFRDVCQIHVNRVNFKLHRDVNLPQDEQDLLILHKNKIMEMCAIAINKIWSDEEFLSFKQRVQDFNCEHPDILQLDECLQDLKNLQDSAQNN